MSDIVDFDIRKKSDKSWSIHRSRACFSGFYGSLNNYDEVGIYVKKGSVTKISEEELRLYIKLFQDMGFHLKLEEKDCNNNSAFFISWKIGNEKGENSIFSSMILMNAIRYLYGNDFPEKIVKSFLYLAKYRMPEVNIFTRFLMAHRAHTSYMNTNHSIQNYYNLEKPLTDAQVKELILDCKTNPYRVRDTLPKTGNAVPGAELINLQQMFKDKLTLKQIYTKYNELCEKYM